MKTLHILISSATLYAFSLTSSEEIKMKNRERIGIVSAWDRGWAATRILVPTVPPLAIFIYFILLQFQKAVEVRVGVQSEPTKPGGRKCRPYEFPKTSPMFEHRFSSLFPGVLGHSVHRLLCPPNNRPLTCEQLRPQWLVREKNSKYMSQLSALPASCTKLYSKLPYPTSLSSVAMDSSEASRSFLLYEPLSRNQTKKFT